MKPRIFYYISVADVKRPSGPLLHTTRECATRGHVWDAKRKRDDGKIPHCSTCYYYEENNATR